MSRRLKFRTITVVEGPEIDKWLARQEALDRTEDERDLVRYRAAYRLLGGQPPVTETMPTGDRGIPMELLA